MRLNRTVFTLVGAALLAGCGAEQPSESEGAPEGLVGEALQVEAEAGERELTAQAYCDDVLTWNTSWASFESQVLTLVNQRRAAGATCGGVVKPPAPSLTLNAKLQCAARKHSKDMGLKNYFSHTGLDGSTFTQRITWAGYTPYRYAGENISAGYTTPAEVVNGWMASAGHCNNIMNPNFRNLGVGYFYGTTSTYKHYWTQNFGAQ
ncbi:MAG TPA: CAP domain-containing protein [Myxococcaceae bacterium]|jgi:uncharacterized protein YkwD